MRNLTIMRSLGRRATLALVVMGAMVYGVTAALAQEQPPPAPHQFFGSVNTGSAAILDGVQAPDGSIVSATNETSVLVDDATITGGTWVIQVETTVATTVVFRLDDSCPSDAFAVASGTLTEVALDLVRPANSGPNGCNGGGGGGGGGGPSGGLAGLELVIAGSPADLSEVHSVVAFCPSGKKAIGGGFEVLLDGGIALNVSEVALQRSAPVDIELTGWEVIAVRTIPETEPTDPPPPLWQLQAFAVCAIAAS